MSPNAQTRCTTQTDKNPSVGSVDCISRQAALGAFKKICDFCGEDKKYNGVICGSCYLEDAIEIVEELPSVEPEIVRCKDCKYFELDHFEKVEEFPVPIIVAHEICMKWSDGCRTSKDGWCFMGERRTDGM